MECHWFIPARNQRWISNWNFFKKDNIPWGDYEYAGFYQTLFDLKHRNQALWNGEHGGELVKIKTDNDEAIYAFTREKNGDKVAVIINLTGEDQSPTLSGENVAGSYKNIFDGSNVTLEDGMTARSSSLVLSCLRKRIE